jgi:FixJ family two-component response regulator
MESAPRSRILVVDDEEAILETMTFTFEDDYEVFTSQSALKGLDVLDERAPVAVVISDQRMPEMTGVEFLARVFQRHPTTVRIMLTGFADMDATIRAINDGHVYAYVTKPWEPEQLKQIVRRAIDHHRLATENERLLHELRGANAFLQAVMDQLDLGAVAVDAAGMVREVNRPARSYLGLSGDPRGQGLEAVLGGRGLDALASLAQRAVQHGETGLEEIELTPGDRNLRLRVRRQKLIDRDGSEIGGVLLLREISHEPLRRRFEEVLESVRRDGAGSRASLERAQEELRTLARQAGGSQVESPGMAELADRVSRTVTALEHWLAVDQSLASEEFPDAQVLLERMRLASSRWPDPSGIPERVRELARRVEAYYESGENPRQRTL